MAKKDKLTYANGQSYDTVNVDHRVGRGGENRPDDVMLVQALLQLIATDPVITRRQLGIDIAQLPEITGNCDARTQSCIRAFQWTNRLKLLNPHDGLIHPASYENRRVVASGNRMAIMLLSEFAGDAALMRSSDVPGGLNLIGGLVRLEPRLKCALT